jgi:hypothetical protein
MHFVCGRTNGNSREAHRLYTEHYPRRRIQFHKFHQRLSESGSFAPSLFTYCSDVLGYSQMENSPVSQHSLISGYRVFHDFRA